MPEIITYTDEKANKIKQFDLLANFMWRRANQLLEKKYLKNEQILVVDPCAGGGKLLSCMNKAWLGKAYEPNYGPFMYAKYFFDQYHYQVNIINEPFEFHFTSTNLPENHLIISVPYTDREINTAYETCNECKKFKNYAYYIMNKSMHALQDGGIGVFALPASLLDKEKFKYEIDCITSKAEIISIEKFNDYAIIVVEKTKSR